MLDKFNQIKIVSILVRNFSVQSILCARRPPKEEYENNNFHTRKRTSDPFDRRWRWTAKSAEPFNVKGGHLEWTQMKITHRGVQLPGYFDPKTKKFVHVKEAVPEIIVPDLKDFNLKPYVSYNVKPTTNDVFDARKLYEKTIKKQVVQNYNKENPTKNKDL